MESPIQKIKSVIHDDYYPIIVSRTLSIDSNISIYNFVCWGIIIITGSTLISIVIWFDLE